MGEWINGVLIDDNTIRIMDHDPVLADLPAERTSIIYNSTTGELAQWARHGAVIYKNLFVSELFNLNATAGIKQVDLTWDSMPGAASYRIQRSADGISDWVNVDIVDVNNLTDTGLDDITTYYYRGRVETPVSGPYSTPVSATTLEPLLGNLRAWYRANGTDRSSNGNNLTPQGTPGTAAGIGGAANAAMSLSGAADYRADIGLVTSGPMSVSLWFWTAINHHDGTPFIQAANGFGSAQQAIIADAANHMDCSFDGFQTERLSGAYTLSAWHHLVITNDGTTLKVYLDGSLSGTQAEVPDYTDVDGVCVGNDATGSHNPWVGRLQFIGIWNQALTQADVTRLYNSGAGFDPTV